ncbi:hypothetical protein Pmani_029417 [Petrolisthes manimaculis]|uniref:Uncharacterized protein n=1 Tax=Petrolisthes manimaculis TaxID=1843537 RepID=A0AAE1TX01_9EUCA|nr:hypothetical protein Pmani_029417 [Petrolisthes manimaculis]
MKRGEKERFGEGKWRRRREERGMGRAQGKEGGGGGGGGGKKEKKEEEEGRKRRRRRRRKKRKMRECKE